MASSRHMSLSETAVAEIRRRTSQFPRARIFPPARKLAASLVNKYVELFPGKLSLSKEYQ